MQTHTHAHRTSSAKAPLAPGRSQAALARVIRAARPQAKLRIGADSDPAEAEADRLADRVVRMSGVPPSAATLRRSCTECGDTPQNRRPDAAGDPPLRRLCADCEEELQRSPAELSAGQQASPAAERAVAALGPGQPLAPGERTYFEPRFGRSLTDVRVHDGPAADAAARSVGARAFALGRNVAFAAGERRQDSAGRRLMAHELAHVVQQGRSRPHATGRPIAQQEGSPVIRRIRCRNKGGCQRWDASREDCEATLRNCGFGGSGVCRWLDLEGRCCCLGADQRATGAEETAGGDDSRSGCTPSHRGVPPTNCGIYQRNSWWLPLAYVNNATCACQETPNSATANCVREFLQRRLDGTPARVKYMAAASKSMELINPAGYQAFVQAVLTPRIYRDHVDAYRSCCCSSGPAPYPAWIGVTSVPIRPCSVVGWTIRQYGSCHGTPGAW